VSAVIGYAPSPWRGVELLDDPDTDPSLAIRSLRDVAAANRWFGGTRAVLAELRPLLHDAAGDGRSLTVLDLGSGAGDVVAAARRLAARIGVRLRTIGLERTHPLAHAGRAACGETLVADALALPFADRSVDVVMCSQVLHHFEAGPAAALLREMHRVARRRVIVADIRRAWGALAGVWLGSWVLGFHPVSRHDGCVSVRRGFRSHELAALVERAVAVRPSVRNRPGFRVTTSWTPLS
jgi:SAM-dependent methyltransferase